MTNIKFMRKLIAMSFMTLICHCIMAQTPSYVQLNNSSLNKAKIVRNNKAVVKKTLPIKSEDIIKDKPDGEDIDKLQRASICAVPENGGANFSQQSCGLANYVMGSDKNIYIFNALGKCYTFSYTKLEPNGENKYVLHTPQAIDTGYDDNSEKIKLYATRLVLAKDGEDWVYVPEYDNNKNFKGDVNFTFNNGVLTQENEGTNIETELPNVIIGLTDNDGKWYGFASSNIVIKPFEEEQTELPEDAEPQNFTMTYTDVQGNTKEENIKMAITENEAYIQCPYTFGKDEEDALWIKGDIKGNTAVFKTQYIGIAEDEHAYAFLLPAKCSFRTDDEGKKHMQATKADEIVFNYDKNTKQLTSKPNSLMLINEGGEDIVAWAAYGEPTIKAYDMTLRKPAAPAIQEVSPYDESDGMSVKFTIETKDINGKYIMPDYLYYNVYFDTDTKPMTFTEDIYSGLDEDMTDIPYLFEDKEFFYVQGNTHLFYAKVENYDRVGVQVLHKIDNNVSRSEIVWAKNPTTKIFGVENNPQIENITYTDLLGRKINKSTKGVSLKTITYSNGKKETKKVVK